MSVPRKEDAGVFYDIFKYRFTAKAKWKDFWEGLKASWRKKK